MRRIPAGCLAVLVAASISGCFLISATGEYELTNESGHSVRIIWTDLDDGDVHTTDPIDPDQTVRLTTQRLLEADSVPPSHCFETFRVEADLSGTWVTVYERPESPDDFDAQWDVDESETQYRRHTFTFVFTALPPD